MPKVVGYEANEGDEEECVGVGSEECKVESDALAKLRR